MCVVQTPTQGGKVGEELMPRSPSLSRLVMCSASMWVKEVQQGGHAVPAPVEALEDGVMVVEVKAAMRETQDFPVEEVGAEDPPQS